MLLSGTYSIPEFGVGLGAAVLGASAATLLARQREIGVALDGRMLKALRRVPRRALVDSLEVYGRLLLALARARPLEGRVRAAHFDPGGEDPRAQTRRALTDYCLCLTPMSIGLGIDRPGHLVLVHELMPPGSPPRDLGLDL
jgi:hypothetical protein